MRNALLLLCLLIGAAAEAWGQGTASSKAFNPDLSVNLLGRYRYETHGSNDRMEGLHNGLSFEESEIQFSADVDVYFRAVALISLEQEEGTTDFGIEPEEVFFETLSIPVVTFKGGKFKASFGNHNLLHTHAFPFIDAPLINMRLLGDEGLNDIGASAAALLPAPFFSEFTFQVIGTNNDVLFNSDDSMDVALLGQWRNLWDLSDDSTFEAALYGTGGKNQFDATSYAYGADLVFKWRPAQGGKYKALIWQTEYQGGDVRDNPDGSRLGGIASWLQYQFAQRWWVQARGEYVGIPHSEPVPTEHKETALVGFFPSEFSGFRLQYDHWKMDGEPSHHAVTLQYNISFGAHPAHSY